MKWGGRSRPAIALTIECSEKARPVIKDTFGEGTSEVSHRLVATRVTYEMAIASLLPFQSHPRTSLTDNLIRNMQGKKFWEM